MTKVRALRDSKEETRWERLVQSARVHRTLYTDAEIFAAEMRHIFGNTWVYVGHESELPEPNDYKTLKIGLRPAILTRDGTGQLHLLFNRCTHRGTRFCRDEYGSAKHFICPYHGWTFSNTGALVGVPHEKAYGATFSRAEYDLGGATRVDSYRGWIFASLSSDAVPLAEHLGHARAYIDRFNDRSRDGKMRVRNGAHRMAFKANWKTLWDNSTDGYHPETSHRSILWMTEQRYGVGKSLSHFYGDPDDSPMYQVDLGNGHTFLDQYPGMGDLWERVRPMPGREAYAGAILDKLGEDGGQRLLREAPGAGMNLNVFPNLLIIGNQIVTVYPEAPDRTVMIWQATSFDGVPEELNVLRMRIAEDFPNFGKSDDIENWEQIQEGLAVPEVEWVDVSRGMETDVVEPDGVVRGLVTSDTGLRGYYKEWLHLMNQGERKPKNW